MQREAPFHYLRSMILVTGGTGMIGSRLLYDLAKAGHQVRALKRENSSIHLFEIYTKEEVELRESVTWVDGNLLEIDSLISICDNVDTVFHAAAMISFIPAEAARMEKINIEGTANLVNICTQLPNFKFFGHVSSVATLGRISGDQKIDENTHWDPNSHPSNYAISKYGAEREVWRGIAEGLPAVIVNPSIVLGPGDFTKGSAALFGKIKRGFPFYTEGVSGFVDVRDVSDALLFLWKKEITGERFILSAEDLSFKNLFDKMALAMKVKKPTIKIHSWMASLAWPIVYVVTKLTGKAPFITRETAKSARSKYYYSSEKIKKLGFEFRTIDECIDFTVKFIGE
ncbi:MAG: NAD-dependent epimerase/dehydratase family protein [Bacteroidia bacterium]